MDQADFDAIEQRYFILKKQTFWIVAVILAVIGIAAILITGSEMLTAARNAATEATTERIAQMMEGSESTLHSLMECVHQQDRLYHYWPNTVEFPGHGPSKGTKYREIRKIRDRAIRELQAQRSREGSVTWSAWLGLKLACDRALQIEDQASDE